MSVSQCKHIDQKELKFMLYGHSALVNTTNKSLKGSVLRKKAQKLFLLQLVRRYDNLSRKRLSSSTVMQEVLGKSYDTLGDYDELTYG
jgi:hypothetical protein